MVWVMEMYKRRIGILLGIGSGILAAVAVFYLLGRQGIGIGCPVYQLTGLRCPGCGNSRAVLALLRLDFSGAFRYNLLFLPELFYLLWVIGKSSLSYLRTGHFRYQTKAWWLDAALLVLLLLWSIFRNLWGI